MRNNNNTALTTTHNNSGGGKGKNNGRGSVGRPNHALSSIMNCLLPTEPIMPWQRQLSASKLVSFGQKWFENNNNNKTRQDNTKIGSNIDSDGREITTKMVNSKTKNPAKTMMIMQVTIQCEN